MSIFRYTKAYLIDMPQSDSVELVKLKYTKLLNILNYETSSDLYDISFKRKFDEFSFDKSKALIVFREGLISLNSNNNKLEILWDVKLDHLYFISLLASIFVSIFAFKFFSLSIFDLLLTGMLSFIMSFAIGRFSIAAKIAEINLTCLEK